MSTELMSQKIKLLSNFRQNLIKLFDDLIGEFPAEGDFIALRIFFDQQMPIEDVMEGFIYEMLKPNVREMIKQRNEEFFLEHNSLFKALSNSKVDYHKRLWRQMDTDNKNILWQYMDAFVYFGTKYQEITRKLSQHV